MKKLFESWRGFLQEGSITLYHFTDPSSVQKIKDSNSFETNIETSMGKEVYFSTKKDGQAKGYGNSFVAVEIPEEYTNLDDEFPDGEQHYWVDADDLKKYGTILKDEDFAQSLRDQYNIELNLSKPIDEELVSIELIKVPEESRGQGIGTEVMKKIIEWADSNKYLLSVEPSSDFGTPKKDLIRFYKEFGFVPNKGKNKDYRTRDTMIRNPR